MLTRYACYLMVQNGDPQKKKKFHGNIKFAIFIAHCALFCTFAAWSGVKYVSVRAG